MDDLIITGQQASYRSASDTIVFSEFELLARADVWTDYALLELPESNVKNLAERKRQTNLKLWTSSEIPWGSCPFGAPSITYFKDYQQQVNAYENELEDMNGYQVASIVCFAICAFFLIQQALHWCCWWTRLDNESSFCYNEMGVNCYLCPSTIITAATIVSFIFELILLASDAESQSLDNVTLDKYIGCSQDPVYQRALKDVIRYESGSSNDGNTDSILISVILAPVSLVVWFFVYHFMGNLILIQQPEMQRKN